MSRRIEGSLYGFGDADFALSAATKIRQEDPVVAEQMVVGTVNLEDVYMILTTVDDHIAYGNEKSRGAWE